MNNNLYDILDVPSNASINEIKKSYKKLVIKWHPDKHINDTNNIKNIEEKFRNIQIAYEILSDVDRKNKYDLMTDSDKTHLFDTFKTYFSTYHSFDKYYNSFINLFYNGDETDLKNDFNKFNFNNIYHNLIHKLTENTDVIFNNCNIEYTLNVSLEDKYNDLYKRVVIPRKTKNDFIADIRILENKIILEKEGELYGSLTINIICNIQHNIQIINNDIFVSKEITLFEYLYGGSFDYLHFNNELINITFDSFINKTPISLINNKGLIYLDDEHKRGDLIIHYYIKNINDIDLKNKIKNL